MTEVAVPGLPVVVIGAGPQGLAAAAHLVERGEPWWCWRPGTVRPPRWRSGAMCGCSRAGRSWSIRPLARLLAPTGWSAPTAGYPTGREWIETYLAPLAAALGDRVRYGTRVVGVSRRGRDRLVSAGRAEQPFTVHVLSDGVESRLEARAVIDASGTWTQPNPAGADGYPALGERAAAANGARQLPAADPGAGSRSGRSAHGRGGQRPLGDDGGDRARRGGAASAGHPDQLGAAPRHGRRHLRRRHRR